MGHTLGREKVNSLPEAIVARKGNRKSLPGQGALEILRVSVSGNYRISGIESFLPARFCLSVSSPGGGLSTARLSVSMLFLPSTRCPTERARFATIMARAASQYSRFLLALEDAALVVAKVNASAVSFQHAACKALVADKA